MGKAVAVRVGTGTSALQASMPNKSTLTKKAAGKIEDRFFMVYIPFMDM
jgi:hypothetical protein